MTIDFACQKCEGTFEYDLEDLIDGTEKLACPHCDAKATATQTDDFTSAVAELRTQVASLSKKFAVSLTIETEDLDEVAEEDEDEDEDERDDDDLGLDDDDDDVDEDDDDFDDEDVDDDR